MVSSNKLCLAACVPRREWKDVNLNLRPPAHNNQRQRIDVFPHFSHCVSEEIFEKHIFKWIVNYKYIKIQCSVYDTSAAFMCSYTNFQEATFDALFNIQLGLCFGVEWFVTKGGKSVYNEAGITRKEAIILHTLSKLNAAMENRMFFSKSATKL